MGLVSKCWKEQDDHQCPYHGPEERALDKLPTQTEQRNTGSPGPWGPTGSSVQTRWDEGPRPTFSITAEAKGTSGNASWHKS